MSTENNATNKIVTLKNVRVDFLHLDQPWAEKEETDPEKRKYTSRIILEKNDPQLKEVKEALRSIATAKWGDAYSATKESGKKSVFPVFCLRDAATDAEAKVGSQEGYLHGPHFFNANRKPNKGPVAVFGVGQGKRQLDKRKDAVLYPYNGCYATVVVEFWAQDNKFGKKVNVELVGIVKTKDGDPLGGNEFNGVDVDTAAALMADDIGEENLTSTTYAKPADAALSMGDL